ncbi:MAG: bifunctional DNA-formamidopyrimidine glycosylase/DNA-(apurinic or apyrimidinic site) lyase [Candidatus Pacebacteria bacterium]|jgi:formamidopyrimidine-DNA glycosylase|nr:bifunctional DNA-formamidopyrimidine glycosylase/DNA-(apurinic or apyrimidinic site) lyase [Candidatus Paceibacterota bacterium]
MPELPEIETIKNGLLEKVLGKPILEVEVNNASVLRGGKNIFKKTLGGESFTDITRRGKMLIFEIGENVADKKFLLARLGMTGRLVYFDSDDALWGGYSFKDKKSFSHKHCHVIFTFEGGGVLLFCDVRRFGYMEIVDEMGLKNKLEEFGPEPLSPDFTLGIFRDIARNKKTNIKAFLLNQKYIAGIGNIYADEILFESKIDPQRSIDSLSVKEIRAVYDAIGKILKKAVANRGTTFSDYVDAAGDKGNFKKFLKVYGRAGEQCLRCDTKKIRKIKIAGRGTSYCECCQK